VSALSALAKTRTDVVRDAQARHLAHSFYVWMSAACVLLAFGGFAPTYWLQLAPRTFIGSPLVHLHAVLFSAWTLFFLFQATLAVRGRLERHRAYGLLGVSLATAMVFVGCAAANEVLKDRLAAGIGDAARAFFIVPISLIVLFGGFVFAAMANVRRPEAHKRLMLLATISIIPPAIARVSFAVNVGMAPGLRPGLGPLRTAESVIASGLIADAFVLIGMIYDWRIRGRPHSAYVVGGVLLVAVQILRVPVSTTQWWYAFADFLARFSS
jgi:hypothetical protein